MKNHIWEDSKIENQVVCYIMPLHKLINIKKSMHSNFIEIPRHILNQLNLV